ncbi:MAG: D-glycero-alpha-D-manno-heptose-1,7-bisphosphate 7-phosphatase [Planctomycetota bacterium]|jgi:D-glycero-D-manno-heptose 1,7-bisphosphate phosphatase
MSKSAAVFLDRDGTIIEDRGYLKDPSEVVYIPGVFASLKRLSERFALFIVTNQSGISKGLTLEDEVRRVNDSVVDRLEREGVPIRALYTCPHDSHEDCECRKPSPYFARAAADQFGLDLARSWAVGDHPHDVAFGENFGGRGVYLLTGHGLHHRDELDPEVRVCESCVEAVEVILRESLE